MNTVASSDSAYFPPARSLSSQTLEKAQSQAVGPDVLRSLTILLVMLVHLPVEATPSVLVGVRNYAWVGVDVFFHRHHQVETWTRPTSPEPADDLA